MTFKKILLYLINLDANRHLFKCTFCKNLVEKKKWKKRGSNNIQQNFSSISYYVTLATCLLNSYIYEKKDHFLTRTAKYQGFGKRLIALFYCFTFNER